MSDFDWTKIDWPDMYPRLLLVAARRLNRLYWRGKPHGSVPGATTPKDIVQDAIMKTIEGKRTWNQQYSLFTHLVGAIYGEISNLVNSADNRFMREVDDSIIDLADIVRIQKRAPLAKR